MGSLHAAVILCSCFKKYKMSSENEPLGKVLDEWEIEGLRWTNTSLLHRLVVTEDMETLRSRKSEITPEMVNLTCAVQEDARHHMACMLGPMDAGNVELVKLLIEAGADPNIPAIMTITPDPHDSDSDDGWVPTPKQWSPLILAVREYKALIVKELLGAGARIAVGENPMKEIEKRPGMDPEITRMMNEAWMMEAPELD